MKVLLFLLILPLVSETKIISTTNGPVKGISLAPKKVEAFLGIPYAEPPVGPLRFARPVPKSSWEETYDADKLPPTCVQVTIEKSYFSPDPKMSEDCLYLNLWIPEGGSDLKPIMLFIHGGGFMVGSSNTKIYDGTALSEHGDVIVASINYRVGTLGFFTASIEDAGGNMGMFDQVMAIQWIKDNAKNFGGDPNNIVLFGESAGAFSVALHLLSPLSRNLFKRAILQSGAVASPMFSKGNGISMMSQMIASQLGCTDDNTSLQKNPKAVVNCMKALSPDKIAQVDDILFKNFGIIFPSIGDEFLPENAIDIYKQGNFKDTEILLGVTRDEGTLLLAILLSGSTSLLGGKFESFDFNETFAREFLESRLVAFKRDEIHKIIDSYLDRVKENPGNTYLKATAELWGDFVITCSAVFHADYYALKGNPVYFYMFDYRADSTPLPEWMGVAHFDEIQYVFGNPAHQDFTEYEKEFSSDIIDMWVAFAKKGNPNIPGGLQWPQYTYQDPKYFVLGKKDIVGVKPDDNRCESWRKLFETVIDEDTIQRLKKSP